MQDVASDVATTADHTAPKPPPPPANGKKLPLYKVMGSGLRTGPKLLDLQAVARVEQEPSEAELRREKLAYFDKQCSKVNEYIYLGSDTVARNRDILRSYGITHVLNCAGHVCPDYFPNELRYKTLWLRDSPDEDLFSVLYDVFDFLEEIREQRGAVLVHCSQGVSRSTSLVIAYLMWRNNANYDDTFHLVKAVRGVANPNMGFACQLLQWQKSRCTVEAPRVFRIAPHCQHAPCYLVPKQVVSTTCLSLLDPRGAFVVQSDGSVLVWSGSHCPEVITEAALVNAQRLIKYERCAPGPPLVTAAGAEPSAFWEAFGVSASSAEPPPHSHLEPVPAYDQEFETFAVATARACGVDDSDAVSRMYSEAHAHYNNNRPDSSMDYMDTDSDETDEWQEQQNQQQGLQLQQQGYVVGSMHQQQQQPNSLSLDVNVFFGNNHHNPYTEGPVTMRAMTSPHLRHDEPGSTSSSLARNWSSPIISSTDMQQQQHIAGPSSPKDEMHNDSHFAPYSYFSFAAQPHSQSQSQSQSPLPSPSTMTMSSLPSSLPSSPRLPLSPLLSPSQNMSEAEHHASLSTARPLHLLVQFPGFRHGSPVVSPGMHRLTSHQPSPSSLAAIRTQTSPALSSSPTASPYLSGLRAASPAWASQVSPRGSPLGHARTTTPFSLGGASLRAASPIGSPRTTFYSGAKGLHGSPGLTPVGSPGIGQFSSTRAQSAPQPPTCIAQQHHQQQQTPQTAPRLQRSTATAVSVTSPLSTPWPLVDQATGLATVNSSNWQSPVYHPHQHQSHPLTQTSLASAAEELTERRQYSSVSPVASSPAGEETAANNRQGPKLFEYPSMQEVELFDSDDLSAESAYILATSETPAKDAPQLYVWLGVNFVESKVESHGRGKLAECALIGQRLAQEFLKRTGRNASTKAQVVLDGDEPEAFWDYFVNG
eukprot:jgi/Chlat1/7451/Chrsp6S07459